MLALLQVTKEVFLCTVVVGELFFGAQNSMRAQENLTVIEDFVSQITVLPLDTTTARFYAETRFAPKRKGQPIPENDLWIGASALQYGLVLITDDRHFNAIEGLQTQNWR